MKLRLVLGSLLASSALMQGAILSLDIAQFGNNATQEGFTQFLISPDGSTPVTYTGSGNITATFVAGTTVAAFEGTDAINYNIRGRTPIPNSGDYTYADLLAERIASTGAAGSFEDGTGNGLYLRITGLQANTSYSLQIWGVDFTGDPPRLKDGTNVFFDATNEAGGLTELGRYVIPPSTTTITDNDQYSVTATVTTDSDGVLIIKSISNMDGSGMISGFILDGIPEPSSISLLGLGLAGMAFARRRKVA